MLTMKWVGNRWIRCALFIYLSLSFSFLPQPPIPSHTHTHTHTHTQSQLSKLKSFRHLHMIEAILGMNTQMFRAMRVAQSINSKPYLITLFLFLLHKRQLTTVCSMSAQLSYTPNLVLHLINGFQNMFVGSCLAHLK